MSRTDRARLRSNATAAVALGVSLLLAAAACSSSSGGAPASAPTHRAVLTNNHSPYHFAAASGLVWYVLPPAARQRKCQLSCQARVVKPAFRTPAIASVDTVATAGGKWRLIIQLRRRAAAQLAAVSRHHRSGSEIVIGVGRQLLVHAPLRLPIVGGVWQISGLRYRTAVMIATQLRRIAAGYPTPTRHHHRHRKQHHHSRRHHRRHHHRTHR